MSNHHARSDDTMAAARLGSDNARGPFLQYAVASIAAITGRAMLHARQRRIRIEAIRMRAHMDPPPAIALHPSHGITGASLLHAHLSALHALTIPELQEGATELCTWVSGLNDIAAQGELRLRDDPEENRDDYVFSYPVPGAAPDRQAAMAVAGGSELVQLGSYRPHGPKAPALPRPTWTELDYIARVLEILLDVVELIENGQSIYPDAIELGGACVPFRVSCPLQPFELGSRAEEPSSARRQPLHSISATEPSIAALGRHWAVLAQALRFHSGGKDDAPVQLAGFHLRRTRDWVVPSAGHPAEVYEHLARVCNVSCSFCYLHGNPSEMAIARGKKVTSASELDTRLRYLDPERGLGLFQAQWEINEFLIDPKLPQVLRKLRRISQEPFFFTTNGNPLTPALIDLLAEVAPVQLIISINTIDEDVRSQVMREKKAQTSTALSALELLAARKIPFGISLAAFPEFSLARLTATIRSLESLSAAFVRINLPGFTRNLPYKTRFDTDSYWREVVEWVRALRPHVAMPLITIPSAYEEDRFHDNPNAPRIVGAIPGSPAASAGLRPGDVIRQVGFFEVRNRAQLIGVLLLLRGTVALEVERDGDILRLDLDTAAPGAYPYTGHYIGKYVMPWGLLCAPSLSWSDARQIADALRLPGVERAWIVTSPLMKRAAETLIAEELPDLVGRLGFVVAQNEFLGGNIRIMDMCTIGDIAAAVERQLAEERAPDLILLPGSGFNQHGRDIMGRHWADLEHWLGIPVRLLAVSQFRF